MVKKLAIVVAFTICGFGAGALGGFACVELVLTRVARDEMSQGIAGSFAWMFLGFPILIAITFIGFVWGVEAARSGRVSPGWVKRLWSGDPMDRPARPLTPRCARCGYNLAGTLGIECPQCGATIPPEQCRYLDRLQAKH